MDAVLLLGGDRIAGGYLLDYIVVPSHNDRNLGVTMVQLPRGLHEAVQDPLVADSLLPAPHDFQSEVINAGFFLIGAVPLQEFLRMLIELTFQPQVLDLGDVPTVKFLLKLFHDHLLAGGLEGVVAPLGFLLLFGLFPLGVSFLVGFWLCVFCWLGFYLIQERLDSVVYSVPTIQVQLADLLVSIEYNYRVGISVGCVEGRTRDLRQLLEVIGLNQNSVLPLFQKYSLKELLLLNVPKKTLGQLLDLLRDSFFSICDVSLGVLVVGDGIQIGGGEGHVVVVDFLVGYQVEGSGFELLQMLRKVLQIVKLPHVVSDPRQLIPELEDVSDQLPQIP